MYNFPQPHVSRKSADTAYLPCSEQAAFYCRQTCEHLYKRIEITLRPGDSYSFSYDGEGTFEETYYYYA